MSVGIGKVHVAALLKAVPSGSSRNPRARISVSLGVRLGASSQMGRSWPNRRHVGRLLNGKVDIGTVKVLSKLKISVDVGQNVFAHVLNAAN